MLAWTIIEGTARGFAQVLSQPLGLAAFIASITVIALFAGAFSGYEQGRDDDDKAQ